MFRLPVFRCPCQGRCKEGWSLLMGAGATIIMREPAGLCPGRFGARCGVSTVSKTLEVGDRAPDITLPTVAGGKVSLRDFHGKRAILFMWASW